ncbi:hypothetical protein [Allonocardiopsis opalescens]|uniref:Uncharacterized protein n=1 Tax=Allonocardiopsis opalescens TaxID=1144618 RepID=A0A2T0QA39_9ACTN|nr:hypothetical protein [Allonocardiopsis opalescens]PRY00748.1 hypothetical protein CLV72_102380 [Allonocardiopsis opalescens]
MTSAIIGLVGALLGALITLFGAVLTEHRQARREERKWRRDQRAAAYDGALRHLLRAANLRSEFDGGGGSAVLRQEHQREWFDDLVQAQFWLHAATRHCGAAQLDRITGAAELLDGHVARLGSGDRYDSKGFSMLHVLRTCIRTVTECAREDGGRGEAAARGGVPAAPATGAAAQAPAAPPAMPWPESSQIPMGGAVPQIAMGDPPSLIDNIGMRPSARAEDEPGP